MANLTYVLVTPARNEERTIEATIESVLSQTCRPMEWVVVSDGSTDTTDERVQRRAATHPWIRLLRLEASSRRNFASVVFATEAGIAHLRRTDYNFLGLLDADVRFQSDYFERLIGKMEADPGLGLAGGLVVDVGVSGPCHQYLRDVAGAAQFFRCDCFRALGGLIAIPEGGWDAITNFQARAKGYKTRTFPDLIVDHLKPRNSAMGGFFRRKWQLGARDYALGYDPLFEAAKCLMRWRERPVIVGAAARFAGFLWGILRFRPRMLPKSLIGAIRREQRRRLLERGGATDAA